MKKSNVLTRCATVRFWSRTVSSAILGLTLAAISAGAQQIKWGLTVININNPITPIIVTNGDGSISITAGGGDTYTAPDSITYAYQQVTGDFDIAVQIVNVTATDPQFQNSPKGSLMVRTSLDPYSYDYQINALLVDPLARNGQIESIGRLDLAIDTDDLPGKGFNYGGDTTDSGYCTYPDVWLRMKRQGDKLMSYFATDNTTDYPSGASPMSTNGWQLLTTVPAGTNFPKTLYVGLSTVSHNATNNDPVDTVTSTYANYGPTQTPHSIPSVGGTPVPASDAPGPFPNTRVLAANISGSISSDGMGYPPNIVQSSQGAPQPIIWNTGDGFGGVTRDIIASITSQSPDGFCFARYQAGAFDFMLSPRDPVAALQN
ncbi:MAG: hypothetical protein ACREIC_16860, partial [Limisphaerales bacterium]